MEPPDIYYIIPGHVSNPSLFPSKSELRFSPPKPRSEFLPSPAEF